MEDIRSALFYRGCPLLASTIPLYASVGCPYTCDFCIDYDSKYRTLDVGTLEEDLRFINANFPNVTIAFHDANFGVRFDETLSVLEKVNNRTRYGVGLTMSVLSNPERVRRLRDTGCRYVQCGIESLSGFHAKQGRQRDLAYRSSIKGEGILSWPRAELRNDAANIIFGLDDDAGPELVDAYVDFIEAAMRGSSICASRRLLRKRRCTTRFNAKANSAPPVYVLPRFVPSRSAEHAGARILRQSHHHFKSFNFRKGHRGASRFHPSRRTSTARTLQDIRRPCHAHRWPLSVPTDVHRHSESARRARDVGIL